MENKGPRGIGIWIIYFLFYFQYFGDYLYRDFKKRYVEEQIYLFIQIDIYCPILESGQFSITIKILEQKPVQSKESISKHYITTTALSPTALGLPSIFLNHLSTLFPNTTHTNGLFLFHTLLDSLFGNNVHKISELFSTCPLEYIILNFTFSFYHKKLKGKKLKGKYKLKETINYWNTPI